MFIIFVSSYVPIPVWLRSIAPHAIVASDYGKQSSHQKVRLLLNMGRTYRIDMAMLGLTSLGTKHSYKAIPRRQPI